MAIVFTYALFPKIFVARHKIKNPELYNSAEGDEATTGVATIDDEKVNLTEAEVTHRLEHMDLGFPYVLFNNVYLYSHDGNTSSTQIDHIIVSQNGIFCIESKGLHGNIYGNRTNTWYQYKGNQKIPFLNPERQNYRHKKALEEVLGVSLRSPIHTYVIFPNAHILETPYKHVYDDVDQLISRISQHTHEIYPSHALEPILRKLVFASTHSSKIKEEHRREVHALTHPLSKEHHKF